MDFRQDNSPSELPIHVQPQNNYFGPSKDMHGFDDFEPRMQKLFPKFITEKYQVVEDLTEKFVAPNGLRNIILLKLENVKDKKMYFLKISDAPKSKNVGNTYIPENIIYNMLESDRPANIMIPVFYAMVDNISISISPYYDYDLCEYIQINGPMPEPIAKKIYNQICNAIKYFHDKNIVLGDIKSDNVMYDPKTETAYLIDFETCFFLDGGHTYAEIKNHSGTENYYAPESHMLHYHGFKTDVWSSGMILYILLIGRYPINKEVFDRMFPPDKRHLPYNYKSVDYSSGAKKIVNPLCLDMLKNILNGDHKKRLNISQILGHAWFQ